MTPKCTLIHGDVLEVLRGFEDNPFGAVITGPQKQIEALNSQTSPTNREPPRLLKQLQQTRKTRNKRGRNIAPGSNFS